MTPRPRLLGSQHSPAKHNSHGSHSINKRSSKGEGSAAASEDEDKSGDEGGGNTERQTATRMCFRSVTTITCRSQCRSRLWRRRWSCGESLPSSMPKSPHPTAMKSDGRRATTKKGMWGRRRARGSRGESRGERGGAKISKAARAPKQEAAEDITAALPSAACGARHCWVMAVMACLAGTPGRPLGCMRDTAMLSAPQEQMAALFLSALAHSHHSESMPPCVRVCVSPCLYLCVSLPLCLFVSVSLCLCVSVWCNLFGLNFALLRGGIVINCCIGARAGCMRRMRLLNTTAPAFLSLTRFW